MYISYDAMLELPAMKGSAVISGEKGLYRTIRWVHIYEMKKPDEAFRSRVTPGSFLLTSCIAMNSDDLVACLSELIYGLAEQHCAGLGIGMGYAVNELPHEIMYLSNQLAIPIVVLPNEVKFIDITYQVSHLIFESYSRLNNVEELLRRLLYFEYNTDLRNRAVNLGYNKENEYQIVIVEIDNFSSCSQDDPIIIQQQLNILTNALRSSLTREQKNLFLLQENCRCILMLPMQNPGENVRKLNITQQQMKRNFGDISISAGIGTSFRELSEIYESLRTAKIVMQAIHKFGKTSSIMEYSGLGVTKLFYLDNAKTEMEEILHSVLGKLLDNDYVQNDELIHTLDVYLATGENIGESAERMFIHRNTMKYRIKKIQELLGCDLCNPEQRYELRTALKIRRFLSNK